MSLVMSSALSQLEDARAASRRAAEEAAAGLGAPPALALVTAPSVLPDLARVGPAVLEVLGRDCPLIGCSHAGGFFSGRQWTERGVGIVLLGGELSVTVGVGSGLASSPLRAMDRAAAPLRAQAQNGPVAGRKHQAVICLTDAFATSGDLAVLSLRDAIGPDPVVVGGFAGDSNRLKATQVLAGGELMQDAAVLAGLQTAAPVAVAVRHGFRPISRTLAVTRTSGRTLYELDGKPALDVILEEIQLTGVAAPQRHELVGFLSDWPVGMVRPLDRGELIVRTPNQVQPGGALSFFGDVPSGYPTFIMHASRGELIAAAHAAVEDVKRQLEGAVAGMLVFVCGGRLHCLAGGAGYQEELDAIDPGLPMFGLHTYGEMIQSHFHNCAVVVLGFGVT